MAANIRPLSDRVLVKPLEEKETKKGGIIIPDSAKEKPMESIIIALGTGKTDDNGKKVPFEVKKGDRVLVSKYGGTEIKLDITKLRKSPPETHVIVGEIEYGLDHANALGLSEKERKGTIVIVKPNLSPKDIKGESLLIPVDVQQYGFLNADFPQQDTFDLWYDEAQFESYRRLGLESGRQAIATGVF